ncbi:MAG: DUF177 domain-containing protein [Porphyromonadaceae bacterium]|nr:MAG: DUF177 domain-containing protein [Porphyromonadaceae bacterium]
MRITRGFSKSFFYSDIVLYFCRTFFERGLNRFSEYIIPFSSYSNGLHDFEFELVDTFFGLFPESEIQKADVLVKIEMIRQERQLEFSFTLDGWVALPCDRCLEEYEQPITGEFRLYGRFGHGNKEDEFDVVWLPNEAYQFDLSQYLYEYVILSLPMRKVHPDKAGGKPGCDPVMLDLLKNLSVK